MLKANMKLFSVLLVLWSIAYTNASITGLTTTSNVITLARKMIELSKSEDVMDMEMVPYHCDLAASYGQLNKETIKNIDQDLLVAIAGTNNLIRTVRGNMGDIMMTFKDYLALMKQNVLLVADNSIEIFREKYLGFSDYRLATTDAQEDVVKNVSDWFANELVADPNVLAATKIDIVDYANIVASTGVKIKNLRSVFLRKHYVERSVVDIGVIRYPDENNPYFKLFRIQLFAYRSTKAMLFMQKDESGIRGQYHSKIFKPSNAVIGKLKESTKVKAAKEALKMFND